MAGVNKVGTNSGETLSGTNEADFLWGEGGADTLNGGDGNDTLAGGNSGGAADTLNGGAGNDVLFIQNGDDTLNGGGGYDIARVADYTTITDGVVIGGVFFETGKRGFEAPAASGVLIKLAVGDDTAEVWRYAGQSNEFDGATDLSGDNTQSGISDPFVFGATLGGELGDMTFTGIQEFQLTDQDDVFFDDTADRVITARGGNDWIDGGRGADTIDGGSGFDTASYLKSSAAISINLTSQNTLGLQAFGDAEGDRLISIEAINGSAFGDTIIMSDVNNKVFGFTGADFLSGVGGDDTLIGGDGNDTLRGGTGADALFGNDDNDTLRGDSGSDVIDGGAGTDTAEYIGGAGRIRAFLANTGGFSQTVQEFSGATATILSTDSLVSIENVTGSGFGDEIFGNDVANVLKGEAGNDRLVGNGGADQLFGGDNDDTLEGGAQDDSLFGENNNDLLRGGTGSDILNGGAGTDTADYSDNAVAKIKVALGLGTADGGTAEFNAAGAQISTDTLRGIENVTGGSGADIISGNDGANRLDGGLNNDVIEGGLGADTLIGGGGTDLLNYVSSNAFVFVNLSTNFASGGHATGDTISGFENILGSAFADFLIGDGGVNAIDGGAQNDTIDGGSSGDTLNGGAGDDEILGGLGNDVIDGGTGLSDTAVYSDKSGSVFVVLNGATDTAVKLNGVDEDTIRNIENIVGGSGADSMTGDGLANRLSGGENNDFLRGGGGRDIIDGGAGADAIDFRDKTVGVTLTLNGAADSVAFVGGLAEDTFRNIENVFGGSGQDALTGDSNVNSLLGGGDNDRLAGMFGNDRLEGGAGSDLFVFNTAPGAGNVDVIADFVVADDTVELESDFFTGLATGTLAAGAFHVGASAAAADDRIIYNNATGALFFDADGAGAAAQIQFATLVGAPALTNLDFTVV